MLIEQSGNEEPPEGHAVPPVASHQFSTMFRVPATCPDFRSGQPPVAALCSSAHARTCSMVIGGLSVVCSTVRT